MRRRYDFNFMSALWTGSNLRQVGYLPFHKRVVHSLYEERFPCIGYVWVPFFKPSRASSGGAGEILLLWGDGSALSLPSGSVSLFCLSYSLCFGDGTSLCTGGVGAANIHSDKIRTKRAFRFGPHRAAAFNASPNPLLIRDVPGNDSGAFTSVL